MLRGKFEEIKKEKEVLKNYRNLAINLQYDSITKSNVIKRWIFPPVYRGLVI